MSISSLEQGRQKVVAISGASGLIGSALSTLLDVRGYAVAPLRRGERRGPRDISWDPRTGSIDAAALIGVDAVINLAGETIAQRWTRKRRRRIYDSRVRGTQLLAKAVAQLARPPRVMVSGSAVGFYGNCGDDLLEETSSRGHGFLADLAADWEEATSAAANAGVRVVHIRTGVVLAAAGGALRQMLPVFRARLGGRLGDGRQWVSWISLTDVASAIQFATENASLVGPVNLVGPAPVRNEEFTRTLGDVLGRPAVLPIPVLALELLFGEMAEQTILASQRVRPTRLVSSGFEFQHDTLELALRSELEPVGAGEIRPAKR